MKKLVLIFSLFLFNCILKSQPMTLIGTPTNNAPSNQVKMYDKFEIDIVIDRKVIGSSCGNTPPPFSYQLPHDSAEVSIYVEFRKRGQSQVYLKVYSFYNEKVTERTSPTPCEWPVGKQPDAMFPKTDFGYYGANESNYFLQSWKTRCAFRDAGIYDYYIYGKDKYSSANYTLLYSNSIEVIINQVDKGFVKLNKDNDTYLFFDNGEMCFLNGVNEFFAEDKFTYMCRMRELIDKMSANNINFMRMWIDGFSGWYYTAGIQGASLDEADFYTTIFNQRSAKIIDELIDYAKTKNMLIQPCLLAPNLSDSIDGYNNAFRHNSPYNKYGSKQCSTRNNSPNIGEIENPWDFYKTPVILNSMKNYFKYCVSRWGYATNIVGWEIGNEINCPGATHLRVMDYNNPRNKMMSFPQPNGFSSQVIDWHRNVKSCLNYYDAQKHLVTTSVMPPIGRSSMRNYPVTNEEYEIYKIMDYSISHKYYINPTCPEKNDCEKLEEQEDAIFRTNETFHTEIGKPTQLQEWGLGDDVCKGTSTGGYDKLDPYGVSHHNIVISSAFAGVFGTACSFNTWTSLQPGNYYYHYKGIGQFMNSFGSLGNPLYTKMGRTLFDTKGHQCNTDFGDKGLRFYYMASSDKLVIGWCQDKRFSFSRLYWNHRNYLASLERRFKPNTENSPNDFVIQVPQKGFYNVKWRNSMEYSKFVQPELLERSYDSIGLQFIRMALPKSLHNDKLADGLFSAEYVCDQMVNYEIDTFKKYYYGDEIPIKLKGTFAVEAVEVVIDRVDANGLFISNLFKKNVTYSDFVVDSKRELNSLYNSTNPTNLFIPYLNGQTTYYRLTINTKNPNNLNNCKDISNGGPTYFKIIGCKSLPKLKVNGVVGSSILKPILVSHGEKIILNGEGSYGGTAYRIVIREIDSINNYLGTEYNVLFNGRLQTLDVNDIVKLATNEEKQFLPSNGINKYKMYAIYHVNFNSYYPSNGCSSWETKVEYVKVRCNTAVGFEIVGGGSSVVKEFAYADPIYLDGSGTIGESTYRLTLQKTDSNGNLIGMEFSQNFEGRIDELIDLNKLYFNFTNGKSKYLLPESNGPAYYKITLSVKNDGIDGGCENWISSSKLFKISTCHVEVELTLNNLKSGNTFNNPYLFKYGSKLSLNGIYTRGETGYRIILTRYNISGQKLNEYNILYKHQIDDEIELNDWYKNNIDSTKINLPAYNQSNQNIWLISLVAFNGYDDDGCETWKGEHVFFKLENDLKCNFYLNSLGFYSQNHQSDIFELCDDEGTYLRTFPINYGSANYVLTMEEMEWATWKFPEELVPYQRRMRNEDIYLRKKASETFFNTQIEDIDLEAFWNRYVGDPIDKTFGYSGIKDISKYYKVTLRTNNGEEECMDFWTFKYKNCHSPNWKDTTQTNMYGFEIDKAGKDAIVKRDSNLLPQKLTVYLYPNPTSSIINISIQSEENELISFDVSDVSGKKLSSSVYNENKFNFEMSSYSSGIYIVRLNIKGVDYNFKVVKI